MSSSRCGPNWLKSVSIFHYPGHSDGFRDGPVTHSEPRRCEKTFIRVSEKKKLLSID